MEKVTLNGSLESLQSKFQADKAGLAMDEGRRDRAIEELQYCVVTAERSGLVIYPSAAAWKETPDIAEGALVRHDQVLLLMPDLSKMQIKVGIHEALVDRVKIGQSAKVTLPDYSLEGEVITVANVARPAGWWTGNMVKYDTVIKLPPTEGLRPGMSAEVEVVLAEHKDVIMVPVSAVVETEKQTLCWVKTGEDIERRVLKLGDSNDVFIVAKSGLAEGDEVVLNPLRYVEDAKGEAFQTFDEPVNDEPTVENVEINNTRSDQQRAANQTTAGESIDVN
jgi:multidrug efflux pump subunit AcrA (membrane-fusion protein)